ncbi:hypothetical protein CV102_19945 [Natronococcus pandeyae]|uniref:Uncharacterized protein n=1 Tax=Natronococcus pandeyae TaxID=2055836 RepID=A0A8J8Q0M7_9EURY|nr:hypothetical protein CV102_19945 [Natronococcus pandeyae]
MQERGRVVTPSRAPSLFRSERSDGEEPLELVGVVAGPEVVAVDFDGVGLRIERRRPRRDREPPRGQVVRDAKRLGIERELRPRGQGDSAGIACSQRFAPTTSRILAEYSSADLAGASLPLSFDSLRHEKSRFSNVPEELGLFRPWIGSPNGRESVETCRKRKRRYS